MIRTTIRTTNEGVGNSISVLDYSTAHIDGCFGDLYFQATTTQIHINGVCTDEIHANFKKVIRDLRKEFRSNRRTICKKFSVGCSGEREIKDFAALYLRRQAHFIMRRNSIRRGQKISAAAFQMFIENYNKATVLLAMSGPFQIARVGNWTPQIKEGQLALPFDEIQVSVL